MALAEYKYGSGTFLFEDNDVPDGAVKIDPSVPTKEAPAPTNKARRAADK